MTSNWQPIETAPTGTLLLFLDMNALSVPEACFTDWIADGKLRLFPKRKPTNWQHLPDPPPTQNEEKK